MARTIADLARAPAMAVAALAMLSACSGSESSDDGEIVESNAPLASVLANDDRLGVISTALRESGMSQVFDGVAYYTVLAPTDEALAGNASGEDDLGDEDQRPALLAILRDHILPGYLTVEDIGAAIDTAGGSVTIQTMGEQALTFTREGDSLRVDSEDGSSALLLPGESLAANGVLLPVDGVLKQL